MVRFLFYLSWSLTILIGSPPAALSDPLSDEIMSNVSAPTAVHIVTPARRTTVTVSVLREVSQWNRAADVLMDGTFGAVVLRFPSPRQWWFSAGEKGRAVDVVLVTENGQVSHVFPQLRGTTRYVLPVDLSAVVYLDAGLAAQYHISPGNLIIPDGFAFAGAAPKTPGTRSYLRRLEQTTPKDALIHYCIAQFHLQENAYSRALRALDAAIRTQPLPRYKLDRARLLFNMGKADAAMTQFQRLLTTFPLYMETYDALQDVFFLTGQTDLLISLIDDQIAAHPQSPSLVLALADLYVKRGNTDAATTRLAQLTTSDPDVAAERARLRGHIALRRGRHAEAAEHYRRFLNRFPFTPGAADLRAFITRHTGKRPSTIEDAATDDGE